MSNKNVLTKTLENNCLSIIEDELNNFFSSTLKAAHSFSILVAKDLSSYSEELFSDLVLSQYELNSLVDNIVNKIKLQFEGYVNSMYIDNCTKEFTCESLQVNYLNETVNSFVSTMKVTKVCENVINKSFDKIIKNVLPSSFISKYIFKKLNLSSRLFGNNSIQKQFSKQQEEILNQVKGILINTKLDIKNELIEALIKDINNISSINNKYNIYEIA